MSRCRSEILETLRSHKSELSERYGLISLGVFCSIARDEAREDSDVDIVVKLDQPDLFALIRLREDLSNFLGCDVDVVHEHQQMRPFLRDRIERESIMV